MSAKRHQNISQNILLIYALCYIHLCNKYNLRIHIPYLEKKSKNDGNQNFGADFASFFSFIFKPVLVFLRRFLTFCVVFWALTSATSCQDVGFFPGVIYIFT